MRIIYYTNKGNRTKNEDSLLIDNKIFSETNLEKPEEITIDINKYQKKLLLLAITDGIGNRPYGSLASNIALKVLKELGNNPNIVDDIEILLKNIIINFQKEVEKNPETEGMGTTLSALILKKNKWHILHIGDCRIYEWDKTQNKIKLLTQDHTHVAELVKKGFLRFEDVNSHPIRNILSSAITSNISDFHKIEYQKNIIDFQNDLFLCSDGVWENFTERQFNQLFIKNHDKIKIAKKIIEKCEESGARDNYSFIIIEL